MTQEALAEEIGGIAIRADVRDEAQVREMVDKTLDKFCQLDILVCNAGVAWQGLLTDMTDDEWHTYYEQLQVAELRMNAAGIFAEKAEQFLNQPESLPKAHYIYEYGWQTIFLLLQFPN